ncbi:MAG: hypothetical protein OQL06_11545 [Gammaproteobacteria bacterium]|nr:hypothetical protein [Gammaproteobacteria bacterium]
MKSIDNFKSLAMVSGAALVLSATGGTVLAEANPFGMVDLSQGYQVAMKEGKCGEGKCGGNK